MTTPLTAQDIRQIRQNTLASLTTGSKGDIYTALQAAMAAHQNGNVQA